MSKNLGTNTLMHILISNEIKGKEIKIKTDLSYKNFKMASPKLSAKVLHKTRKRIIRSKYEILIQNLHCA